MACTALAWEARGFTARLLEQRALGAKVEMVSLPAQEYMVSAVTKHLVG
jgi:hypothetical protein